MRTVRGEDFTCPRPQADRSGWSEAPRDPNQRDEVRFSDAANMVGVTAFIQATTTCGFGIGGALIARNEWRLHRTRPKPEAVHAYADQLEAQHGREAFRLNGEARLEARVAKNFDRYRFLKESQATSPVAIEG